nr:uncharacterized protein LOC107438066 [Parasteatoda tepidariorum]
MVQSESYVILLIPIILQLLPEDFVLDFQRKRKSKDETDVNELLLFLKNEIECRESVAFLSDKKTNYNHRVSKIQNTEEKLNESSDLAAVSNETPPSSISNEEVISSVSQCNNKKVECSKRVYLQTCTAEVKSDSSSQLTRILLDNGSQRSFLSERVANNLNLKPVAYEVLSVYSFGMQRATEKAYPVVEFEIFKKNTNFRTKIRTLVIPCITGVKVEPPDPKVIEFMNKNKIDMADSYLEDNDNLLSIELLIGSDLFWEFLLNVKISINNRLCAIKTVLGWVISGSSYKREHTLSQNIAVMKSVIESGDMFDLRNFWSLDSLGITKECEILSLKDKETIDKFEGNLKYENNRYKTGLLWNSSPDDQDNSQITYFWINNNNSLKPFVQNRVSEIQTLTDPKLWQHCSGSSNPADKLTRGESLKSLVDDNLWKFGPSWLIEDENSKETFLILENYSSLLKVKRIMAWSKRFIHNCRSYDKLKVPLTTEELKEAEVILLKEVQNNYYQDEIKTLMKKEDIKNNSSIICLRPYLDEKQILRIWSRLFQSEVDPEAVNPILLPKNSKFSELLITEKHKRLLHRGVNVTLSQIRKSYWIPQARQLVKRIIGRCVIYRKHFAKPANQRTGELPKDRISRVSTFLSGWS